MWLLDSGATFRVIPHREWFLDYLTDAGLIQLGNGEECRITGLGEIPIQLPNGSLISLHQVWHVPDLKRKLISISMLAEDGEQDDIEWVIIANFKRNFTHWPWREVQLPIPTYNNQSRGITQCSQNVDTIIVAWPTKPHVTNWGRKDFGTRLHHEA